MLCKQHEMVFPPFDYYANQSVSNCVIFVRTRDKFKTSRLILDFLEMERHRLIFCFAKYMLSFDLVRTCKINHCLIQ